MNTLDDVVQRLNWRLDYAANNPGPYAGAAGDMGLEVGDDIFAVGRFAGWTRREWDATPHKIILGESDDDLRRYMREFWQQKWAGLPSAALERRETTIKRQRDAEALYWRTYSERYGPPKSYRTKTLENFIAKTSAQVLALDVASRFPCLGGDDDFCQTHYNLVLTGPVGTGKTHLAAAVFKDRLDADGCSEFISATALIRKFREKEAKESVLLARYGDGAASDHTDEFDRGCETLFIDDFGIEADRYASEIFNEILDRRMTSDLMTVVTTNCTEHEILEWLGERGLSRLTYRCKWVALDGEDYRLKGSI
jgi:DNA replication protein DnaC